MEEGRKPEYPEKSPGDELQKMPQTTIHFMLILRANQASRLTLVMARAVSVWTLLTERQSSVCGRS